MSEQILRIIDAKATVDLLPMALCIDAMGRAMRAVNQGLVLMPPRTFVNTGQRDALIGIMPCVCAAEGVAVTKLLTLTPSNTQRGEPTVQGFAVLTDLDTGRMLALIDGAELTKLRTAAASALATQHLARADATTLGLFGTGPQASSHLAAMREVRDLQEVRVWARNYAKAQDFAQRESDTQLQVLACRDPREAACADIVCTVTGSPEPILLGEWVSAGAHVNLVGAHSLEHREADSDLIARADVYVDSRAALAFEGGDITIPIDEGRIDADHVCGEIGELLAGSIPGRRDDSRVTVYNSVGLAAQDLFAAVALYARLEV